MRSTRKTLLALPLLLVGLIAYPLHAQAHEHPTTATTPLTAVPSAEAKAAFALIKSLSGRWQGPFVDPMTKQTSTMEAILHVTSRGNSVVHEMKGAGDTDDPSKNDHPVTMMYIDGANLLLTHYCDAGNRPRMAARLSPDGKQVDFDFLDVSGPTTHGHMQHVRFTFVDSTHHAEQWTWLTPSGKTMSAEMQLQRVESVASIPSR